MCSCEGELTQHKNHTRRGNVSLMKLLSSPAALCLGLGSEFLGGRGWFLGGAHATCKYCCSNSAYVAISGLRSWPQTGSASEFLQTWYVAEGRSLAHKHPAASFSVYKGSRIGHLRSRVDPFFLPHRSKECCLTPQVKYRL